MTRSFDPIVVSPAPYTAVPSTLSLPIREPVSLASTAMFVLLCWKNEQQAAQGIVPASKFCEEPYWRLPDRNLRRGRRFISQEETSKARQMRTGHSLKQNQSKADSGSPRLGRDGRCGFRRAGDADRRSRPVEPAAVADRRGRRLQDHR